MLQRDETNLRDFSEDIDFSENLIGNEHIVSATIELYVYELHKLIG